MNESFAILGLYDSITASIKEESCPDINSDPALPPPVTMKEDAKLKENLSTFLVITLVTTHC